MHMFTDTHRYKISKGIGINEQKEICLSDREYLSYYRCERIYTVTRDKIFVNVTKKFIDTSKIKFDCQVKTT